VPSTVWGARRVALGLAGLALMGLALGGLWLRHELTADQVPPAAQPVRVTVPPGASLRSAARALSEARVLHGAWKLELLGRLTGQEHAIKSGVYDLLPGGSPARLLHELVAGNVVTLAVTIPEGLTLAKTAAIYGRDLQIDAASFRALAREPRTQWRERLGLPPGADLEGYLFPETYRFMPGSRPEEVITAMIEGFAAAFDSTLRTRAGEIGLSPHEAVTLASIVEAEAALPQERARVAAVYHNRLRRGMRLEADPTVAYAAGVSGDSLTLRNLELDSPYNTYRRPGLPPGPICSPGRAALVAALWPEPGCDALYFVADGAGGHRFSESWQGHLRNVRAYRRLQHARGGALDAAAQRP
jgi:UPF0755 protein